MRRTKIEIIGDMLQAISNKGGRIKPTHLLYKANLSHKVMQSYLDELMTKALVDSTLEKKHKMLILTDKGYDFLAQYRKMKEFQDSFGL